MKKVKIYILSLAALVMVACSGNEFKVSGKIDGASDTTQMVMEVANNGWWLIVDSVKCSKDGSFAISKPAAQSADIYRLRYNDKSIYFPIDSLDNVNIVSNIEHFATDYVLSGTAIAEDMMKVDKKAMQMYGASSEDLKAWKVELTNTILANPSSIVAYYIINKYIGNEPLYNPLDKEDLKMIGAVANAYNSFKPNDPRTEYLVSLTVNARRAVNPVVSNDTIVATEIPLIDINLQDENGKMQQLSEVASQGKVVLLNFTVYGDELSPAFNKVLSDIYGKYATKGLEIYQIAYDYDEFQWRQAAKNLPWITVLDSDGIQSKNLSVYNVASFPEIFIINRKGEIVERVMEIESLSKIVAKYM